MNTAKALVKLAKVVVAGAESFRNFGRGTDAKQVFNNLVDQAAHESGHGGYTGTIAEKHDFKIVAPPMTIEQARKKADEMADKSDKFGPAFAIPIVGKSDEKVLDLNEVYYATTSQEAADALTKDLEEKYKGLSFVVRELKAIVEKSSNVTLRVKSKQKPVVSFEYRIGWNTQRRNIPDIRSAIENLKADVEAMRVAGKEDLPKEITIEANIANPAAVVIDVVQRSQKGNKYRLTGKVVVSKPSSNIEGYYFFGEASS